MSVCFSSSESIMDLYWYMNYLILYFNSFRILELFPSVLVLRPRNQKYISKWWFFVSSVSRTETEQPGRLCFVEFGNNHRDMQRQDKKRTIVVPLLCVCVCVVSCTPVRLVLYRYPHGIPRASGVCVFHSKPSLLYRIDTFIQLCIASIFPLLLCGGTLDLFEKTCLNLPFTLFSSTLESGRCPFMIPGLGSFFWWWYEIL